MTTSSRYLVRANGEDYKFGKLNCCDSRNGRFAFPFTKRGDGGDLPGAAYDVRIYANGAEIAHGGFGVNGRGGLDNDGQRRGQRQRLTRATPGSSAADTSHGAPTPGDPARGLFPGQATPAQVRLTAPRRPASAGRACRSSTGQSGSSR